MAIKRVKDLRVSEAGASEMVQDVNFQKSFVEESKPKRGRSIFGSLLLMGVGLGIGVVIGSLWTKVKYLEEMVKNPSTAVAPQQQQAPAPVQVSASTIKSLWDKNLIKFGDANRKVLFVEIGDPSCPFCHIATGLNPELNSQSTQFKLVADGGTYVAPVQEMKKLVDQGKASFAFIYFPGHGTGEMATKAMYCAYDQGRFWPVHDKLMTNAAYDKINNVFKNDKTKVAELVDFIGNAADGSKLTECLDSGKYDSRLAEEQKLASSLGVQGTPGFFVNTTNFGGAYSWNDMKSVVEAALK